MQRAWPTHSRCPLACPKPLSIKTAQGCPSLWQCSPTTSLHSPPWIRDCNAVSSVRSFSSAAKIPTQSRIRPAFTIPGRYISDEELHRRIRELRDEEAKQARRDAFQLAVGEALTQTNPTIQAYQLATAEALVRPDSEANDQQDEEVSPSTGVPVTASLSQVDEKAFVSAVDAVLRKGLAEKNKVATTVKPRLPPAYVRTGNLPKRATTTGIHPGSQPPSKVKSVADGTSRRRVEHLRRSAGLPRLETDNGTAPEEFLGLHAQDLDGLEDNLQAKFAFESVYDYFPPEWNAFLKRFKKVRYLGIEILQTSLALQKIYQIHEVHFEYKKSWTWRNMWAVYMSAHRRLDRSAHALRFEMRVQLVNRLVYGDAVTLKQWKRQPIERIYDATSGFGEVKYDLITVNNSSSYRRRAISTSVKLLANMHEVCNAFLRDHDSFYLLSYIRRLQRNQTPFALVEKAHFVKTVGIVNYALKVPAQLKNALFAVRLASASVEADLKVRFAKQQLPLKVLLYQELRTRVHIKANRVTKTLKEIVALLDSVILVSFLRTKLAFENGLLQQREVDINQALSKFVMKMREKELQVYVAPPEAAQNSMNRRNRHLAKLGAYA